MKTNITENSTAEQYFLSTWHKPVRTKTNKIKTGYLLKMGIHLFNLEKICSAAFSSRMMCFLGCSEELGRSSAPMLCHLKQTEGAYTVIKCSQKVTK